MSELSIAYLGWLLVGLAVVAWLCTRRSRELSGGLAHLLKALVPSWKFFDEAGPVPRLFVRTGTSRNTLGPWRPHAPRPCRAWWHLFVNAPVLEHLADETTVMRLVDDATTTFAENPHALERSVSYRLVDRLARIAAVHDGDDGREPIAVYQFKIALCDEIGPVEDAVQSPIYTIEHAHCAEAYR